MSATIFASRRYRQKGGIGEIFRGDCRAAEYLNTGLHLIINILSTLLLVASNFCAHILSAPTRAEVDKAHENQRWLDIGVPSVKNLRHIAPGRTIAWVLLLVSSGLLHLTYNSAVFLVTPKDNYRVAFVTSDFASDLDPWTSGDLQLQDLQRNLLAGNLTELRPDECSDLYLNNTIALYDVVVVAGNVTMTDRRSKTTNTNSSLLFDTWNTNGSAGWIYGTTWPCLSLCPPGPTCAIDSMPWCRPAVLDGQNWTVAAWNYDPELGTLGTFSVDASNDSSNSLRMGVNRCFSAGHQSWTGYCTVRYSFGVMIVVCILNAVKITCLAYTWWLFRKGSKNTDQTSLESIESDHSLVTVGDAVASFLKRKDPYTKNLPLVAAADFAKKRWPGHGEGVVAERYRRLLHPQRWYKAPTLRRWLFTALSGLAASAFVIYIAADAFKILRGYKIGTGLPTLFETGLGTPQPYAISLVNQSSQLGPSMQFWIVIIVANVAQLGVSVLYFLVTGLLAVMAIADEWSRFIVERKTLRLSSPHGIQRSSYFLALPYRLSLPLMAGMAILHWLISQSLFVISTESFYYAGTGAPVSLVQNPEHDTYMVGFSFPGGMLAMIMGISLLIWTAWLGLSHKVEGINIGHTGNKLHMPLASSCSAAISAACHAPEIDDAAHLLPVIWGRVPNTDLWCFTSAKEVDHDLPDAKARQVGRTPGASKSGWSIDQRSVSPAQGV
ncbi:hypothetical protein LTR33_006062 [Friedmanniomyces endolithicus]|nr:hypothetical protein LTR33_006062 [Friedmanniomyces endolithicus]